MRYQVAPMTVWQSAYSTRRGAVPKISWRVIDTHAAQPMSRDGIRAWSYDEAVARQIADMLNGTNLHASHWQAQTETARRNALALETRWQATLDHTNGLLREAREAADILRKQLFEARDQRDEARTDARNAWAELKKPCAQTHEDQARKHAVGNGYVTLPVEGYNKLVDERRRAETERDAANAEVLRLRPLYTFIDGEWMTTT
jgi:hypothetical protein